MLNILFIYYVNVKVEPYIRVFISSYRFSENCRARIFGFCYVTLYPIFEQNNYGRETRQSYSLDTAAGAALRFIPTYYAYVHFVDFLWWCYYTVICRRSSNYTDFTNYCPIYILMCVLSCGVTKNWDGVLYIYIGNRNQI